MDCLEAWWREQGRTFNPDASELVILADSGGSRIFYVIDNKGFTKLHGTRFRVNWAKSAGFRTDFGELGITGGGAFHLLCARGHNK